MAHLNLRQTETCIMGTENNRVCVRVVAKTRISQKSFQIILSHARLSRAWDFIIKTSVWNIFVASKTPSSIQQKYPKSLGFKSRWTRDSFRTSASLHRALHVHPSFIQIRLKYYWKGCKALNHHFLHLDPASVWHKRYRKKILKILFIIKDYCKKTIAVYIVSFI